MSLEVPEGLAEIWGAGVGLPAPWLQRGFVLYQKLWKHAYRDSLEVKQDSSLFAVNLSVS